MVNIIFTAGGLLTSALFYLESSKYCSLGHEPSLLICFQDTDSILYILDDLFPRLFQTKVQISTPETTIVAVKDLVTLFQWKKFGNFNTKTVIDIKKLFVGG